MSEAFKIVVMLVAFVLCMTTLILTLWSKPTIVYHQIDAVPLSFVGFYHLWLPNDITQKDRLEVLLNTQLGILVGSAAIAETKKVHIKIISESEILRTFAETLVYRRLTLPWVILEIEHVTKAVETEEYTLNSVHAHCHNISNLKDYVWYIHDKGAFHGTPENTKLLPAATGFALSAGCRDQVVNRKADFCGMRWLRYPHAHFAASNMWIARCSYISRLPTLAHSIQQRCNSEGIIYPNGTLALKCLPWVCGCDRFASEHWIGLGATFAQAADCLGYFIEPSGVVHTYYGHYVNLEFETYGTNCSFAPKSDLELAFEQSRIANLPGYPDYIEAKKINLAVDKLHFNVSFME
jgi:hypothetical protein